jgi:hypothetical protein
MVDNPSLIEIQSKQYGVIQLRRLQRKDLKFLQELRDSELSSRELVVRFVHNQLYHPDTTQEIVQDWPDTRLESIVIAWAKNHGNSWSLAQEDPLFDAFATAFRNYLKDYLRAMKEARQLMPLTALAGLGLKPMFLGTNHLSGMSSALGGISIGTNPSLSALGLASSMEAAKKMIAQSVEPALNAIQLYNQTSKYVEAYLDVYTKHIQSAIKASESFVANIQATMDTITWSIERFALDANRALQILTRPPVDDWPKLSESLELFRQAYEGGQALEEHGYGFVFPLWSFPKSASEKGHQGGAMAG